MNKEPLIELSAIAGKRAIERTKLPPIAKISINWTIDQVAEHLKKESLSDIEKIRNTAKYFDIDKVIVIPVNFCDGTRSVVVKVYGKQYTAFIKNLGLQIISETDQKQFFRDINEREKNFGVLIYEKKN